MFVKDYAATINNLDVINFFKQLKIEGYCPSSVSAYDYVVGYNGLIVFNDSPDFYVTNKRIRMCNSTADGSEFTLNLEGRNIEATWSTIPDQDVVSVISVSIDLGNGKFSATIDFFKMMRN